MGSILLCYICSSTLRITYFLILLHIYDCFRQIGVLNGTEKDEGDKDDGNNDESLSLELTLGR